MTASSFADQAYAGQQAPHTHGDDFNTLTFMVRMMLSKVRTALPVRVMAVSNAGELGPVGTVDVQPLVHQMDGAGYAMPLPALHGLPYFRLQGGASAVILDPKVGDIGLAVFADRDISAVKGAKGEAPPGSFRQFDLADGLFVGGFLNGTPAQVIRFTDEGISIASPTAVRVEAPVVSVVATTSASVTAPTITLGAEAQTLGAFVTEAFQDLFNAHTHPAGSPNTGTPNQPLTEAHMTATVKGG